MPVPVEDDVGVNLVGADDGLVLQAVVRHLFEFTLGEDPSHGIVRVAEQEEASLIRESLLESVKVDDITAIVLAAQLHGPALGTGVSRCVEDVHVDRGLDEHALVLLDEGARGHVEA